MESHVDQVAERNEYKDYDIGLVEADFMDQECHCVCNGVETEKMIMCDNVTCPIGWWHQSCAGLKLSTKKWTCPVCKDVEEAENVCPQRKKMRRSGNGVQEVGKSMEKSNKRIKKVITQSTLKIDDAIVKSYDFFLLCIDELRSSKFLKLNKKKHEEVVLFFTVASRSEHSRTYSETLVRTLWPLGNLTSVMAQDLNSMASEFHKVRFSYTVSTQFEGFISKLQIDIPKVKFFIKDFLLESMFLRLIKFRHATLGLFMSLDENQVIELSNDEEQVLRYVVGYIPHKLIRFFSGHKNSFSLACKEVVKSWRVEGGHCKEATFLNYTKNWVDQVNRGGIFKVNDTVYLFFRRVEGIVKGFLHTKNAFRYSDVSLRDILLQNLMDSPSVISGWNILVPDVSPIVSSSLYSRVLEVYVDIRCRSFVSVCNYLIKKSGKASKKGEKGLRKTLK